LGGQFSVIKVSECQIYRSLKKLQKFEMKKMALINKRYLTSFSSGFLIFRKEVKRLFSQEKNIIKA
jgi:hypothetical protein